MFFLVCVFKKDPTIFDSSPMWTIIYSAGTNTTRFELCDKLEAERSRARGIRRDCEPKQRRSRLCWGPNNKGNCHVFFPLVKKLGRKTTLFLFGGGVGAQKKKFKVIFKTVLFVVRLIDVCLQHYPLKLAQKLPPGDRCVFQHVEAATIYDPSD